MRVLLTDRSFTNGYSLGLAAGLRANGVQVSLGGPARSGEQSVTAIYPRSGIPGQRMGKAIDLVGGSGSFLRLLATVRPNFFHIQWPTAINAAYALTAKHFGRIPLVYTAHNPVERTNDPEPQVLQRRLIALADLVLTHGPRLQELIEKTHPGAVGKTHAVEHGNYEHVISRHSRRGARTTLGLPVEGPLFVFVGQLRPRKGVDVLIEAFSEYRKRGGIGQLLVVGAATVPAYARELQELARPCGVSVHWRISSRPVDQTIIDLAISAATQVMLPFQDASQSGSLILAMTYGRCVVSTRVGEVKRTLEDRGILVDPGDRDALVNALSLAERDPELCDEIGERARQYVLTAFSWSAIGARTCELYRTIPARMTAA